MRETHVAITFSGTTARMYLDGVEVGSNAAMTLNPTRLGSTTLNYLGKSQFDDPYLDAALDDFRIYSRAFSAGGIAALASPSVAWRWQHFGTMAETGSSADSFDADRDGLTNRWEYFHRTNPNVPTNAAVAAQLADGRITLTFPRDPAATDLLVRIQGADSPAGPWTNLAETGGTRAVTFTDLYFVNDPAPPRCSLG